MLQHKNRKIMNNIEQ